MSIDARIPYVARAIRVLRSTQTALAEFQSSATTDSTKRRIAAAARRVSRVIAIELKKLEAK